MFHFSGFAPNQVIGRRGITHDRFPHSEIPGSKVARHLPEAYRSHATSFIASISQGIHHLPVNLICPPRYKGSYPSRDSICSCKTAEHLELIEGLTNNYLRSLWSCQRTLLACALEWYQKTASQKRLSKLRTQKCSNLTASLIYLLSSQIRSCMLLTFHNYL